MPSPLLLPLLPPPALACADEVPLEEVGTVPDALGVQVSDGGVYALGAVRLADVDRLVQEGLVREVVRPPAVASGVAGLCPAM